MHKCSPGLKKDVENREQARDLQCLSRDLANLNEMDIKLTEVQLSLHGGGSAIRLNSVNDITDELSLTGSNMVPLVSQVFFSSSGQCPY